MPWDVGGVRVTGVVELVVAFPVDFFAEATPTDVAAERGSSPTSSMPAASTPSSRNSLRPDSLLRQSISSSAPTCTLTTWVGTRVLSMENGYRHSPARAICSAPLISIPLRSHTIPCTRLHTMNFGRGKMAIFNPC